MFDIVAKARRVTEKALLQGALHSLSTEVEIINERQFVFTLRTATNLRKKSVATKQSSIRANPFLPYETALYVAELGRKHVCILNKYNVLPEHLLIITREFESQQSELTREDFAALMMIMAESGGLGFFNGGEAAGASQPHKHLQWVPADTGHFPLLNEQSLPFVHHDQGYLAGDAESCYQAYLALRSQAGWQATQPFNLLITPGLMRWIPRSRAVVVNVSINSLGFAGSFFVSDKEQAAALRATGLMNALCQASGTREINPD